MQNRLFNEKALRILLFPWKWRLVTSFFPPRVKTTPARKHGKWMTAHTHAHPYREALVVLSGNTVYGKDGKVYPCGPGTVFFFDLLEPHDQGYPGPAPDFNHLWISITHDQVFAWQIISRKGKTSTPDAARCLLSPEEYGVFFPFNFSSLKKDPAAGPDPALARLKLLSILGAIVAAIVEQGCHAAPARDHELLQKRKVEAIRRHIFQTGGKGADLESLAMLAGYSKYHFLRLFEKYSGQSVHHYVNACRRRKTAEMLEGGEPLKAIADKLGFSCPASFRRWLRQAGLKRKFHAYH